MFIVWDEAVDQSQRSSDAVHTLLSSQVTWCTDEDFHPKCSEELVFVPHEGQFTFKICPWYRYT